MRSRIICILFLAISLIISCSENPSGNPLHGKYSEDTAMAHYLTEPERAIQILDSAVIIRNLPECRADYLKAIILYSSKDDLSESMEICERLIESESWKEYSDEAERISFQVDVYRLMATIATTTGNHLAVLRYCRIGSELAHGVESLRGDEADFLSRMGFVMCRTGQTAEGIESMRRSEILSGGDDTWSSYISYLNNAKKLYYAYSADGNNQEGRRVVKKALMSLDRLRNNPSGIRFAPDYVTADPEALDEFIDFYRVPFYSYLCQASAAESQLDSSLYWLGMVRECPQSDNPSIASALVKPLIALGRYDEAQQLITSISDMLGASVNDDRLELLKDEMELAMVRGEDAKAIKLSRQIMDMSDSLNSNQFRLMLADEAARYQLQDEKQRRVDTENKLLWSLIMATSLAVLVVGFIVYSYINRLKKRHKELKKRYAKAKKQLESFIGTVPEIEEPKTLDEIYKRAVDLMEGELLFKDPAFDINALAQQIPTNRSYLSSAINTISGTNFRSWLAKFRIEHAKRLLVQDPRITNDHLAEECGFDNRVSLYRQFKAIEGITPAEWVSKNTPHM